MFFSRLDRQRNRCPRRLKFCQRVLVFEIAMQLCVSQPDISARFRGSLILWAKCFAVSARSNLSWAKYESLMKADLYRVASSLFRIGLRLPSNTSLSCSFSRGVITALVFALHPDSLMMSGACLRFNVQVLSSLINSNSKQTVQQQKAFHV